MSTEFENRVDEIERLRSLINKHINKVKYNMMTEGIRDLDENEFRISSIGYCPRKLYFQKLIKEEKPKFDPNAEYKSPVIPGIAAHLAFQSYDPEHIIKKEEQVLFDDGIIKITGHIDNEIENSVLDYKSISVKSFDYRYSNAENKHKHQANTYAILKKQKYFAIVYLKKSDYDHIPHVYLASQQMFADDILKLHNVLDCVQKKKIPAIDFDFPKWDCKYCKYCEYCDDYECGCYDDLIKKVLLSPEDVKDQ